MAIKFEQARANRPSQDFTPKPKNQSPASNPSEDASARATQSHQDVSALQAAGLQSAAAYIQHKRAERNAIVRTASDTIAYLCDPDLLEADIMSAAAAKISARSTTWGYTEPAVDFDSLFALPINPQCLLEEP